MVGTSNIVLYSRLSPKTVEAAIQEQVAYFAALGRDFEWKAFAHDTPTDLIERLAAHGFSIDEREAVLVLDLQTVRPIANTPTRVTKIAVNDELRNVAAIRQAVYPTRRSDDTLRRLALEMEHMPDGISVYVASVNDAPAACGWVRFPRSSAFASIWGGSTIPEFRNLGLYSELLGVRVEEARGRGYRYLTVDARSMSRPILEKHGFQVLTFATACTWSPPAAAHNC